MSAQPDNPEKRTFKQWRAQRPFVAGLLLICSGAVMLAPAYLTLKIMDVLVVISTISGVSTLLLGALLIMFGIGCWLKPATAPYLGVLSIILAVVALPTSNFGGFILGSVLGVVGGAMALAWEPGDRPPRDKKRSDEREEEDGEREAVAKLRGHTALGALAAAGMTVATAAGSSSALESGELPPTGASQTVTADSIGVTGNVKVGLVTVDTPSGPQKIIELRGDDVAVDNIAFALPGPNGPATLRTGPGKVAKVQGNPVVIRARSLTATPALAGAETIPVTVDANGNLAEVSAQLARLGFTEVGVPDAIMQHVTLKDVRLDTLSVQGTVLDAPGVSLTAGA